MGYLRACILGGLLSLGLAAHAGAQEMAEHSTSAHLVDLSEAHWCHDCVVKVIDQYDIMSGFQDHTFRGDWLVNRYELAAAVARSYNQLKQTHHLKLASAATGRSQDIDVLPEHWAYHYVRKLVDENNLLSMMFFDGKYQGNKLLTRKELAYGMSEFLMKMEEALGHPLKVERRESQLAVDHDLRSIYQPYIDQALNRYQFMNLHADHTFRADAPVTRYDLAAALCKVFELFEKDADRLAHETQ